MNHKHIFIFAGILALAACNGGITDSSKATAALNEGLKKIAPCEWAKLGNQGGRSPSLDNTRLPELLVTKGYAQVAVVDMRDGFGSKTGETKGFVLTESGQKLAVKPGNNYEYPCIRQGVWQINKVEAIDNGTDASGRTIANVRATIRFVPEAWLESTRQNSDQGWARLWENSRTMESKQWMYQLVRSGDDFFFTGPGKPVN